VVESSLDTSPRRKSASQLRLFSKQCQRRWGYEYIEGLRPPPNKSAELGLLVHGCGEKWLRDRIPPDLSTIPGKIFFAGMKFLPAPHPALEVEREFLFQSAYHEYKGFVDLGFLDVQGIPNVFDHKTTGDFKWALTERELTGDIQANLYAKEALIRYPAPYVDLTWVYYRTRGSPAAFPIKVRQPRDLVEEEFAKIEQIAFEIDKARHLPVLELPKNLSMCEAYGGCPHIARCHLAGTERMTSIMSQSLIEQLRARNAGANGQAPPAPMPQAPPPQPQIAPPQPTYAPVPQAGPASQVGGQAGYVPAPQGGYVPQAPVQVGQPYVPTTQQPVQIAPQPYVPAQPQPYVPMNPPEQHVQLPAQVEEEKPKRAYTKREKEVTSTNVFHLILQCAALIGGRTPDDARRAFDAVMAGPK
jgi:hypothetical protein